MCWFQRCCAVRKTRPEDEPGYTIGMREGVANCAVSVADWCEHEDVGLAERASTTASRSSANASGLQLTSRWERPFPLI